MFTKPQRGKLKVKFKFLMDCSLTIKRIHSQIKSAVASIPLSIQFKPVSIHGPNFRPVESIKIKVERVAPLKNNQF